MKVHLFYKLIKGLEPQLYAFTTNKHRAMLFLNIRQGFYYKIVDTSMEKIDELKENSGDLEIELQSFKTSIDGFRTTALVPSTEVEIKQILLHKEELALRLLQESAVLPIHIFNEEMQEALQEIGYGMAYSYFEEIQPIRELIPDKTNYELDFEVDELGLFILLHHDSINVKNIRDLLEDDV
jgi:hypothetical protein